MPDEGLGAAASNLAQGILGNIVYDALKYFFSGLLGLGDDIGALIEQAMRELAVEIHVQVEEDKLELAKETFRALVSEVSEYINQAGPEFDRLTAATDHMYELIENLRDPGLSDSAILVYSAAASLQLA